jgi:hypothetical protein
MTLHARFRAFVGFALAGRYELRSVDGRPVPVNALGGALEVDPVPTAVVESPNELYDLALGRRATLMSRAERPDGRKLATDVFDHHDHSLARPRCGAEYGLACTEF